MNRNKTVFNKRLKVCKTFAKKDKRKRPIQKARLVCLLHCIKEYTVLNAVTMLNGQRQVIKSFFKVAILLLLSVFLMTIDISEGIIGKFGKWIKRRVCDACNFGCQTDYISCHINLKTGCGSKRELCWEKCKRTRCWNRV